MLKNATKEKKEVKCVLKPDQIADPVSSIATETVVSPSDRVELWSVGASMQDKGAQGLFKHVLVSEVPHCETIPSQMWYCIAASARHCALDNKFSRGDVVNLWGH